MREVALPRPPVDRTIVGLRARVALWKSTGAKIALVPTMGALHGGHLALIHEARKRATKVLVSIFVNPAQFSATEDFGSYPRDEDTDLATLAEAGTDTVFAPSVADMYPTGFVTTVAVAGPAAELESTSRPHFFGGVATVVTKLLHVCSPDFAIFGEKDYQQLLVIKRLVTDLAFPVEIVGIPTVREADGVAMSSRNTYLTPAERVKAPQFQQILKTTAGDIKYGASAEKAVENAQRDLSAAGFLVDYVKLRNADTLARVTDARKEPLRLLAAVWLGKTRLIDNIAV